MDMIYCENVLYNIVLYNILCKKIRAHFLV